jgi:hypothetical protein
VIHCGDNLGVSPALIRPSNILEWMQDKLDPEIRAASRWAYINATFLMVQQDSISLASTCILYPCLRTYMVEIKNNKLLETQVDEGIMEIEEITDIPIKEWVESRREGVESANSRTNGYYNYTTVKSMCRAKDYEYNPSDGTSIPSAPTPLILYNFTHYGA